MSIATELWRNLTGGKMSAKDAWAEAEGKVSADVGKIVAKGGAIAQIAAQDMGPVIKQGLSDIIGIADTAAVAFLGPATDAVAVAFSTAATGYLGPALGGELSAAARDGLYKIRDTLIAELNAQALAFEASLTTPAPVANTEAAPAVNLYAGGSAVGQGTTAEGSNGA